MIYFTSDWHIGHKNIRKLGERPFADDMTMYAQIMNNYNKVIQDDDLVYFVGDIFWNYQLAPNVLSLLNGNKILIMGNHDKCFKLKSRDKYIDFYKHAGFTHVLIQDSMIIADKEVMINHFPYQIDNIDQRYYDYRLPNNGKWLIHGHIHQNGFVKDKQINVSVEMWDYKPVSIDTIKNIINGTFEPNTIQMSAGKSKPVGDAKY